MNDLEKHVENRSSKCDILVAFSKSLLIRKKKINIMRSKIQILSNAVIKATRKLTFNLLQINCLRLVLWPHAAIY